MAANLPYIPTGYEGLPSHISRNREIANALTQAGLQGPGPNARHGAQLLGSLAQALAGGLVSNRAMKDEGRLQEATTSATRDGIAGIAEALSSNTPIEEVIGQYGGNQPPEVRALLEELFVKPQAKRQELAMERGAPQEMLGPGGVPTTVQFDKAGGAHPLKDYSLPPVISNVHGVATALQRQQPGAILPQPLTDSVIRGPLPKEAIINPLALGAKQAVAAAGASRNSTNVFLPGDKAYDTRFGGLQAEKDNAALDAGIRAPVLYATASRALKALDGAIVGPIADQRLWAARALAAAGIGDGKNVAQTEVLLKTQIDLMLAKIAESGMGTGNGFTEKDAQRLQEAAGGTITMSKPGLQEILSAQQRAARALQIHGQTTFERVRQVPGVGATIGGMRGQLYAPIDPDARKRQFTRVP